MCIVGSKPPVVKAVFGPIFGLIPVHVCLGIWKLKRWALAIPKRLYVPRNPVLLWFVSGDDLHRSLGSFYSTWK